MPAYKHQKQSLKKLGEQPRVFDMSDPGTGKTYVQIMDYAHRRKTSTKRALIFAPKSLLQPAWGNDFKKFAPHLNVSIAYATNRMVALKADADVYIVNHDGVDAVLKMPPAWFKKFDTLIIDESTAFKHNTAKRAKNMAKLVKHFKHRRMLSGTPNPNGVCDLWHQFLLLDDGKRLGKSFFSFRSTCCTPEQVGPMANMIRWHDKPGVQEQIDLLVSDIVIRHSLESCTDIPKNHMYALNYELPSRHMAQYKALEEEQLLILKDSVVTAINGAVLYTKLMQTASGAVYNDDMNYSVVDSGRYELVMDLLAAREHSVVFFNWKHQRDELCKLAEKRGYTFAVIDGSVSVKEREYIVEHYQKGFYKALFAHPQSAGHGLTLTRGTTTIWSSPTYNLEHFDQGNRRIYRISQKQKTETIVIVAPETVDEIVWNALQTKSARMNALLDALKKSA